MKTKYQTFLEWLNRKRGKVTVLEAHEKTGASKGAIRMVVREDLVATGMLESHENMQRRYYTKTPKWNLAKALETTKLRLKEKAREYKKRG